MREVRRIWRVAFAIATPLGLFSVGWVYLGMMAMRKPLPFFTALLAGLPDWYFWALLTPFVLWLAERYPISRTSWPRAGAIHLCAGSAVAMLELLIFTAFNHFFYYNPYNPPEATFADAYIKSVLRFFQFAFLIYWLIITAVHALRFYRDAQRRELEASRLAQANAELASRLAEAQLEMLRAQLHPHFLFNALNAISALVRERRNPDATELIAKLGALLHQALGKSATELVTLGEELELLDSYVSVERARYRERLDFVLMVEPAAVRLRVPPLILQPLVENAVQHGMRREASRLRVEVRAQVSGDGLLLSVADDGLGMDPGNIVAQQRGLGLRNTAARLEGLYGARGGIELRNAERGGAVVTLRVPSKG